MERTLYVERTYNLGDYKSIKFSNALTGIPQELATNDRVIGLLYTHQFLTIETAYRRYYSLIERLAKSSIEETLAQLETERTQTMEELYAEVKKIHDQQEARVNAALAAQDTVELDTTE